jgi:cell wall-associated NlpC family hydrolase
MATRPAPPALQRRLMEGCQGGDVMGTQRALYHALKELGSKATNDRSGKFGPRTKHDVQTLQRLRHIAASGQVGVPTFLALWNDCQVHPAGGYNPDSVAMLYRTTLGKPGKVPAGLKQGAKGKHVSAMQRMLWRALGGDSQNARNGTWGAKTTADMRRFHQRCKWPDRPHDRCGQATWEALWPFGDDNAKTLARKAQAAVVSPDAQVRQKIRSWGEWYVTNRARITYAQVRPYPKTADLPIRTDCSGSATSILRWAGCPNDPHQRGWDGQGYTGTMQVNGNRIPLTASALQPGDCVFYGNQGAGISSHVVIVIGPGDRAMTFGHNPPQFCWISSYWRDNLRTDIGARRYF